MRICSKYQHLLLTVRREAAKLHRLNTTATAILCPGQGSQYVGMFGGHAGNIVIQTSPKLRSMMESSKQILQQDLFTLGNQGPPSVQTLTKNCQPMVVLSTLLTFEREKENGLLQQSTVTLVAGYSVGEISSLYIGGLVSFQDVMEIVRVRGAAMQKASELKETGMLTIQGISMEDAHIMCCDMNDNEVDTCQHHVSVAIHAYPTCVVVGGSVKMLNRLLERKHQFLSDKGKIKINPVPVSGAFHTKYMRTAQEELNDILHKIKILKPEEVTSNCDVYSNVTGRPFVDVDGVEDIRNLLTRQICETVRWSDVIENVNNLFVGAKEKKSVDQILELGPGNQLKSMLSKVNRKLVRVTESVDLAK